jgi:hypothetical protein
LSDVNNPVAVTLPVTTVSLVDLLRQALQILTQLARDGSATDVQLLVLPTAEGWGRSGGSCRGRTVGS